MTVPHPGANLARAIGATILEVADERGLTVHQVGEAAGIRATQLRRMIDGEDAINTDHLVKIATALGVTTGDLLGAGGDAAPDLEHLDFESLVYRAHHEGWAMQGA